MRKLMWFTLGFGTACGVYGYVLWLDDRWIPAFIALCLCTALAAGKKKSFAVPALILLGLTVGSVWFALFRNVYLQPLFRLDGETESYTVTADNYSEKSLYGTSLEGKIGIGGRSYPVLAYLKGEQQIRPGDRLTGDFRLRLTIPGGIKESDYYQGKGIFLIASQVGDMETEQGDQADWRYLPARLSKAVKSILGSCLPEDVFPFAQALLLGDTGELDYEINTALQVSGIRHIIAVSGLHVAILYGMIVVLTGNKRYLTALVGLPMLLLFAAMAGFTPSVSRAAIMIGLMMLARVLDREDDTPTELAFACLILLVRNPFVIASVSFQLSVSSVAGILLFHQKLQMKLEKKLRAEQGGRLHRRIVRWLAGSVSLTLSAISLSTPLSAHYFGTVSLIGVVTNVAAVWMVSLIFYGILAVCGIVAFWPMGGAILGKQVAWLIRYVLWTARLFAKFPFAAVYTSSGFIVGWIVFCYLLLFVRLVFQKGSVRRYLTAGAAALSAAVLLSWYIPRRDSCRMTVLDVGQGQSILFQSKGHSFLVDCGGSGDGNAADQAAQMLLSQGVRKLDGILLTHYDQDHMGGIPLLLTRVKTESLILPFPEEDDFEQSLPADDARSVVWAENGQKILLGDAVITILDCKSGKNSNENSLGILFETEDCVILVTGDRNKTGERALLKSVEIPDVDVLIAGHHGSKNSTTEELLNAAMPETVMISVGKGNSYGHPAQETLERLENHGCTVFRTDEMGTILFRR